MKIGLLTAGKDKPYALGMAESLLQKGIEIDFIGNDDLEKEAIFSNNNATYYNLRGAQGKESSIFRKVLRVLVYYYKLIRYAATTKTQIFHILWLNKLVLFDCTLLNLFYKLKGKTLVYTAHNINIKQRDGGDNFLNRFSLRFLYHIVDHIFVHTENSKCDLLKQFNVDPSRITVIPFALNNKVPETALDKHTARKILGLNANDNVLLFFGNIAPYKGLDILIEALKKVNKKYHIKLIVAGRVKATDTYWRKIERSIYNSGLEAMILKRIEYIPDDAVEVYFKAADALVLPYRFIYQSGPLFLAYNFGLPVIANNVGQFTHDIVEGRTGFVSKGCDPIGLSETIDTFFKSDSSFSWHHRRNEIKEYAINNYSWAIIAEKILKVYQTV